MEEKYTIAIDQVYETTGANDLNWRITTSDHTEIPVYINNGETVMESDWTTSWSSTGFPQVDTYPKLPNALGVIYVDDGVIKCRTPNGDDIILGEMSDGDEKVSINIIATIAKKLLEQTKEIV